MNASFPNNGTWPGMNGTMPFNGSIPFGMPPPPPPGWLQTMLRTERMVLVGELLGAGLFAVMLLMFFPILAILFKNKAQQRSAPYLIIYCVIVVALTTMTMVIRNCKLVRAFVDARNFPGGPLAQSFDFSGISYITNYVAYGIVIWMQNAFMIWRLLLFCQFNFFFTAVPCLMFLVSIALHIMYFVYITHMDADLSIPESIKMGIPICAFSLALNLTITLYIVGRTLMTRKAQGHGSQSPGSKQLSSVTNNLIESSALYSVFGITFVSTFALRSPGVWLVAPMQGSIPAITSMMIIKRIGEGTAWSRDSFTDTISISAITFATPPTQTLREVAPPMQAPVTVIRHDREIDLELAKEPPTPSETPTDSSSLHTQQLDVDDAASSTRTRVDPPVRQ